MPASNDKATNAVAESNEKESNVVVGADDVEGASNGARAERRSEAFERYINLSSVIYFGTVCLASWEGLAISFQFALSNGGPSSMIYGCILVGFGTAAVAYSFAEMASIDPVVGAQYRWSASFAPANPRFWGLIQGWLTVAAWIVNCAGLPGVLANNIIGLIVFNHPDYTPHPWHTTLMMWGLSAVPLIFNLRFRQVINVFELLAGIFHVLFFISSIVTLVVLARRSTVDYVFNTLTTGQTGWNSPGICWSLGLLTVTIAMTGVDGVLHMSDEVKKVRTRAPQSIIIATISNAIMLFAFILTLLFTIGDVDSVVSTPTGVPLIEIYYQATNSKPATTFLTLMPIIVVFFALFNFYASVSRLIWCFAKDNGLPFSKFFATVHPTLRLPINALFLVWVVSILLSVLYVVSTTAFNAIVSLEAISLNFSYIPPILFILIKRLRGQHVPWGSFKMGWVGVPVNMIAVGYLIFIVIFTPFPVELPVTGSNMNYAGPILGFIIVAALLDWSISGRKRFNVPVLKEL